jgi:acyl dehydratase
MSPSTAAGLVLGDVAVGDALPILDVDVTPTTVVLGALASRDWRPMHHDYKFATERNGVADIFLNTPNQAAWIERYITDWTGPKGRIGRMKFRMRDSVFPGDRMSYRGTVTGVGTDDAGHSPGGRAHRRRRQPLGAPRQRLAALTRTRTTRSAMTRQIDPEERDRC